MVSQIYDPTGFVQPFILPAKKLLQVACHNRLSWDEPVSFEQRETWDNWLQTLEGLQAISIPRCIKPPYEVHQIQLHLF